MYQVQALPYPIVGPQQLTATGATNLGALPTTISYPAAGSSVSNAPVSYFIIQEITVVNADASNAHTVNIYDNGTGNANLIATIPVAPGRSSNPGFSTVVLAGHTLYASVDAANQVTVKISGSAVVG